MNHITEDDQFSLLEQGTVIPAHPLVLNAERQIDEIKQRRLTGYYVASGAGGVAVGVHTTQFEIRQHAGRLYEKVLALASQEIDEAYLDRPFLKVAGICGPTNQAVGEALLAVKHGYHLGLVSMGGLRGWSEAELLARIETIASIIPVFGFYLQPAVGGRALSCDFWQGFAEIPNVRAIKVAAFNRYQTLDVMRAVAHSDRYDRIAMYTGNDDNIVADLLTPFHFRVKGQLRTKRFVGGLLGHWAVWTKKAVELFDRVKHCIAHDPAAAIELLAEGVDVTDMNAAIFDPAHNFHGCIPGIHEVLRRQGLMDGTWCLNPAEQLSLGQDAEITRVAVSHRSLTDDEFIRELFQREQNGLFL